MLVIIDYLIVHELAHLLEPNHAARFWNIVAVQVPNHLEARRWLIENGNLLEVDFSSWLGGTPSRTLICFCVQDGVLCEARASEHRAAERLRNQPDSVGPPLAYIHFYRYIYQTVNIVLTANQAELVTEARAFLERVPGVRVRVARRSKTHAHVDAVFTLEREGQTHTLVLEARSSAEPRHVRAVIAQLREVTRDSKAYGVLVAPWVSPESRGLLEAAGMGFIDLQGNARLAFGPVFIERLGAPAPRAERRALRSLWKPASARVLRVLLREPRRDWNLLQLSETASVSHAQTHKVKTALLDRDWITEHGKGRFKTLRLTRPDALLEAWRAGYEPSGQRTAWYTMLERNEVERALEALREDARMALASFSAARRLAPYARTSTEFFYANQDGLNALRDVLELKPVDRGENVVVFLEPEEGVFLDAQNVSGLMLTSPVQTYLDLSAAGNRGAEAAAHLFETRIRPTWEAS